jgi:hypothetical protein
MKYNPVEIARQFLYIREAQTLGQNQGQRVNAIQMWSGGKDGLGQSWCDYFATMVLDIAFQGVSPIPREGSTEATRVLAGSHGWLTHEPSVGDLVLSLNAEGRAHHVGIVTQIAPLKSIAGNTSEDGVSSNGDRVAEHTISPAGKIFVHYPRL